MNAYQVYQTNNTSATNPDDIRVQRDQEWRRLEYSMRQHQQKLQREIDQAELQEKLDQERTKDNPQWGAFQ